MHTHVGRNLNMGGRSIYAHGYAGRTHALTGCPNVYEGAVYTALCGKTIRATSDPHGISVQPVTDPEARTVSCKRCLRRMAK